MDTVYSGVHSILFGSGETSRHTWEDWGLVPSSRPHVSMPSVVTNTIEIPGSNGVIDLSELLLGMPTYRNRTGSWTFNIAHDTSDRTWSETYSLIASYLHGRKRTCILTDDRSYYYEGRFAVDSFNSGTNFSDITIKYDLQPFKWMVWTTTEDWEWDPFDFIYGDITQATFKNIIIPNATRTFEWSQNEIGDAPVTPTFIVTSVDAESPMALTVENTFNNLGEQTFELPNGNSTNPQIMFACPSAEDKTIFSVTGNGSISIDFRPGRL